MGGAPQHSAGLRPALECDGSLDRDTTGRPVALSAAARPALHLFRFCDSETARCCESVAFSGSSSVPYLLLPVWLAGRLGIAPRRGTEPPSRGHGLVRRHSYDSRNKVWEVPAGTAPRFDL